MIDHTRIIVGIVFIVLIFMAGMATQHRISTPSPADVLEASKPLPGATLPGGAVVAPRDGVTVGKKSPHATPIGTKTERVSGATVVAPPVVCPDGVERECPAVHVDVTTVALDDGGKQLVFWSDGKILDTYDTPTVFITEKRKVWHAFALGVDAGDGVQPGAALVRDVGPFSVAVLGAQGFAAAGFGLAF